MKVVRVNGEEVGKDNWFQMEHILREKEPCKIVFRLEDGTVERKRVSKFFCTKMPRMSCSDFFRNMPKVVP